MWIYVAIFLMLLSFTLIPDEKKQLVSLSLLVSSCALILLAGLRGVGVDKDYHVYKGYFDSVTSYAEYFQNSLKEPAFVFIPVTLKKLGVYSEPLVFTTFSLIGVLVILTAIVKYSKFPALSMLVFYSNYFFLHEMTQIRAGIACGILIHSLKYVTQRNVLKFVLCILMASFFHYTAFVFLVVYLLNGEHLKRWVYASMLVFSIGLAILGVGLENILQFFNFGILTLKLDLYIGAHSDGTFHGINIFNALILLNVFMAILILITINAIKKEEEYVVLFTKLQFISLTLFYLFSTLVVFAWRFSELFGIVQFLLFPMAIYSFKEKWIGQVIVTVVAASMFYLNIFYANLLNPYFN